MKRTKIVLLIMMGLPLMAHALFFSEHAKPTLKLTATDRILVLAPHPDDEILGTAGIIQRALSLKIPVKVVFLTYGDNNAWSFTVYKKKPMFTSKGMKKMGEVRREEALNASKMLGLDESNLVFLGYPDHGTMNMWCYNWGSHPAFRGSMTRSGAVPYENAFRYEAPYRSEEIVKDLTTVINDFKPTKIFTTSSADENPDHRALYLFLRVTLWNLAESQRPAIFPFLIHYRFRHWPVPQGYFPVKNLTPPPSLESQLNWQEFPLQPLETLQKYKALLEHKTQFKYSGRYLSSFVRANELFGEFPILRVSASDSVELEPGDHVSKSEIPEEFTEEEKNAFVDLEKRTAVVEEGQLKLSISYLNSFKGKFRCSIYLFGYRKDVPFPEMPKIRIEARKDAVSFFNGKERLKPNVIQYVKERNELSVKVPLDLLNNPNLVLTGVQTSLDETPLDTMAWRILVLPK